MFISKTVLKDLQTKLGAGRGSRVARRTTTTTTRSRWSLIKRSWPAVAEARFQKTQQIMTHIFPFSRGRVVFVAVPTSFKLCVLLENKCPYEVDSSWYVTERPKHVGIGVQAQYITTAAACYNALVSGFWHDICPCSSIPCEAVQGHHPLAYEALKPSPITCGPDRGALGPARSPSRHQLLALAADSLGRIIFGFLEGTGLPWFSACEPRPALSLKVCDARLSCTTPPSLAWPAPFPPGGDDLGCGAPRNWLTRRQASLLVRIRPGCFLPWCTLPQGFEPTRPAYQSIYEQ